MTDLEDTDKKHKQALPEQEGKAKQSEKASLWSTVRLWFGLLFFKSNPTYNTSQKDTSQPFSIDKFFSAESTRLDWLNAINYLQKLIRNLQLEIDTLDAKSVTFDILGVSTYLLQVDVLLARNRQHLKAFEKREKEFNPIEKEIQLEFLKANSAFTECYQTHIQLILLMRDVNVHHLKINDIIDKIKTLDLQTRSQGEAVQLLNDFVLKKAPLYQLFESELFRALYDLENAKKKMRYYPYVDLKDIATKPQEGADLRKKAHTITQVEYKLIAVNLISYYGSLKQYYDLLPTPMLETLSDSFKYYVEAFISEANKPTADTQELHHALNGIFSTMEAARFIPKPTYYHATNIQDKARLMRRQLRQFLAQTELGKEFLESHLQLSIKDKLFLKRKF